jgi:hypothetical protein
MNSMAKPPVKKATAKAASKKRAPAPKRSRKANKAAEQGKLIARALESVETRLKASSLTPTISDFIRLLQLQKEMGFDQPRQVNVQWVETHNTELKTEE